MAKTKKDNEEIIEDLKANNKKTKKNEEKVDSTNKETKEETTKKVKDIVQKAKEKGYDENFVIIDNILYFMVYI